LGYKNISAFVTHSVFPKDSYRKIKNFHNFYTTNSVPEVTDKLKDFPQFKVINLFGEKEYQEKIIYVASHNEQKLEAVYNTYIKKYPYFNVLVKGIDVSSDVSEQPIGKETKIGSINRMNNMKKYLDDNNIKYDYCVSLENGINYNDEGYFDFCCCNVFKNNEMFKGITTDYIYIPKEYYDECVKLEQRVTIGEVIQNFTGIPKNNWHQYFNKHKCTRIDIMEELLSYFI
jgi:non-canonical (house-cleaning) NTP pyrophosphatase